MFLRNGQIDIAFRYARRGHGPPSSPPWPASITSTVCAVTGSGETTGLSRCAAKTHTTAATKAIAPQITAAVLFFINTITAQHPFRVNICALLQSYSIILGGILESLSPILSPRHKMDCSQGEQKPMRRRNICIRKNQLLGWRRPIVRRSRDHCPALVHRWLFPISPCRARIPSSMTGVRALAGNAVSRFGPAISSGIKSRFQP